MSMAIFSNRFRPNRLACVTSLWLAISFTALAAPSAPAQLRGTGALKVITGQPGSVVFINRIRHGVTNEAGVLELARVKAGNFPVLVRTVGFTDWKGAVVITAGSKRELKVTQQPTNDQALIQFQKGERLRDAGKNQEAVSQYKAALALRPVFPEARVGMVRCLITLQDFQEGEKQIQAALKEHRGPYPEAQTVLANMRRQQGLIEEAIVEYRRAIRLASGVSPEAHIGLAIALEEQSQSEQDEALLAEAIKEFRLGIAQDMDTEPILYYLLGSALEKAERKKEAIEAYQTYLRLDPEGQYASAVESIIEQLKQDPEARR